MHVLGPLSVASPFLLKPPGLASLCCNPVKGVNYSVTKNANLKATCCAFDLPPQVRFRAPDKVQLQMQSTPMLAGVLTCFSPVAGELSRPRLY